MNNLLLDTMIGALSNELQKARQEAVTRAIEAGYNTDLHWRLYSDNPNMVQLWGRNRKRGDVDTCVAQIKYVYNMRIHEDSSIDVRVEHYL